MSCVMVALKVCHKGGGEAHTAHTVVACQLKAKGSEPPFSNVIQVPTLKKSLAKVRFYSKERQNRISFRSDP